ncbi:hypothetical protein M758_7G179300 [Ceratodon purpureus]|uniref:H/ACA ribonucleoprotein complex subunit 2 n=1 Tax=Ceratodon purpureus TaxID=3225 RepID=A0A8T0H7Y4_CERPU|nr:hypothetical protein KC19_7G181700 [Ceratodon purpureus]KAG0611953.1 hypothetical protein M758_7G179300 [Ceratodon purpureus]
MASDGEDDRHDKDKDRRKRLAVSPIAKPLAGKKLTKKTLKVVKKAASSKQLKRGVKEVVKAIRKGQKGYISVDSILLLLSHLANQDENIILTLSAFFCTTVHSEENMRDLLSIYFFSASLH